jgi:hypothetical protein
MVSVMALSGPVRGRLDTMVGTPVAQTGWGCGLAAGIDAVGGGEAWVSPAWVLPGVGGAGSATGAGGGGEASGCDPLIPGPASVAPRSPTSDNAATLSSEAVAGVTPHALFP